MGTPVASIVVPTRGGRERLPVLLRALAAQTEPDWEAIVVVDGDVDDSAGLLANWGDARVRSLVVRRSLSMARSMRCWIWMGCTFARKRRADGRSNRRSKKRSTAVSGGMVGRGVYQRVPRDPGDAV